MKTNETMPGAARRDASANGPSVAETIDKACPCCGGRHLQVLSNGIGDYYAICKSDDDDDQQCGLRTSDRNCETIEGALERWNRRVSAQQISAPLPIPREVVEKAESALRWFATHKPASYLSAGGNWIEALIDAARAQHAAAPTAIEGRERQLEEALRDLLACEAKCDDGDPRLEEARTKARAALAGAQPKDDSSS